MRQINDGAEGSDLGLLMLTMYCLLLDNCIKVLYVAAFKLHGGGLLLLEPGKQQAVIYRVCKATLFS